ncbi:MAG: esterase [Bacteroidaceae bacterium]|nr:esterase [Bacteroidaceae bacterium]
MKKNFLFAVAIAAISLSANAQGVEDYKPASTNQEGKQYPMVNSEGRVRAQISAPEANSVKLDIGGVKYEMKKDENGVWTGESEPQDVGFHYYQLNIDGASVPDPNSLYYYGASRWGSGIEIPSPDEDIFAVKNVPQGSVNEFYYYSSVTEEMRRCFIYFPAEYYSNPTKKFPVLYLQHGMGENEFGWSQQGHTAHIMDNLIAEGKAVPFVIVMDNGLNARPAGQAAAAAPQMGGFGGGQMPQMGQMPQGQRPQGAPQMGQMPQGQRPQGAPQGQRPQGQRPQGGFGGFGGFNMGGAFQDVLLKDIIPFVEKNFRVYNDTEHRAMAGLSMGGMQTRSITLANPTVFAYVGMFSGGSFSVQDLENATDFKKTNKVLFMSCGSKENMGVMEAAENLKKIGYNAKGYISEGTAHEWHTWRRSLFEFAQLIFK